MAFTRTSPSNEKKNAW